MRYETEGYVKSVKISANSPDEDGLGFIPIGAYLLEENGQAHCLFKAGASDVNDKKNDVVVEAKLLRFDKAKAVSMQTKSESLRNALITAKVNHSKIRIEIDGTFFNKVHEDLNSEESSREMLTEQPSVKGQDGKVPTITAIEFT